MVINIKILALFIFLLSNDSFGFSFSPFKDFLKGLRDESAVEEILTFKPKKVSKAIQKISVAKSVQKTSAAMSRVMKLLEQIEEKTDDDDILDSIDRAKSILGERLEYLVKSKKSLRFMANFQYNSWQDSFTQKNLFTNVETEFKNMNRGPCVGGGLEYGNSFYRLGLDLCFGTFFVFSNTTSSETVSAGSGVDTMYVKSSLFYRYLLDDRSSFRLGINLIFRSTDLNVPSGNEIDGTTFTNYGGSLSYLFQITDRASLSIGFGGFLGSGTLSWENGLIWTF